MSLLHRHQLLLLEPGAGPAEQAVPGYQLAGVHRLGAGGGGPEDDVAGGESRAGAGGGREVDKVARSRGVPVQPAEEL